MLRTRSITASVALAFALLASTAAAARADAACEVEGPNGTCLVRAGGGSTSTRPVANPGPGTGVTTCSYAGEQIPCTSVAGTWWASRSCYVALAEPQPPQDTDVWDGHTDGAIYKCSPPVAMPGTATGFFWAASNPVGGPSPRALADQAVEAMNLRAGQIGIVPEPGPGKVGIVGMPAWMWIADPGESTVGPITRSASGGGITVTATARLDRVVW